MVDSHSLRTTDLQVFPLSDALQCYVMRAFSILLSVNFALRSVISRLTEEVSSSYETDYRVEQLIKYSSSQDDLCRYETRRFIAMLIKVSYSNVL